jgi:hypothetical protein
MIDVSPSGFRIRYRGEPLEVGAEVEVSYTWGDVKVHILWMCTRGEYCEGFFVLK